MAHQHYKTCIDACNVCALACDHCASACLGEPDPAALTGCIRLDMDCAQACRLATAFMARDSEHAQACCELCAQVCDTCAEECAKHEHDHCRMCAQACRHCAEACRNMG